jgi:hypothetical protein
MDFGDHSKTEVLFEIETIANLVRLQKTVDEELQLGWVINVHTLAQLWADPRD